MASLELLIKDRFSNLSKEKLQSRASRKLLIRKISSEEYLPFSVFAL